MTATVVDLAAARQLRALVDNLGEGVPSVEVVRAIGRAARGATDRRWMAWACEVFDAAHDAEGCCA